MDRRDWRFGIEFHQVQYLILIVMIGQFKARDLIVSVFIENQDDILCFEIPQILATLIRIQPTNGLIIPDVKSS
jgi:hypothetical protein